MELSQALDLLNSAGLEIEEKKDSVMTQGHNYALKTRSKLTFLILELVKFKVKKRIEKW